MDMLGFAAFGGMERVAIIAGALLIGYWGYRLYAGGKTAGLAFLGIACVMLFGALLTGGSHVRSVGEGIQLASAVKPPLESVAEAAEPLAASEAESPAPAAERAAETSTPSATTPPAGPAPGAGVAAGTDADALHADAAATAAAGTGAAEESAARTVEADVATADASAADAIRRLATAQELGGRIVAVKSDNVSLEWSTPESER